MSSGSSGELFGSIIQNCDCWKRPTFSILNGTGDTVFTIRQAHVKKIMSSWEIVLTGSSQGERVVIGKITNYCDGIDQPLYVEEDTFGAEFPMDLDPRLKATLLGAVFVLVSSDYDYELCVTCYVVNIE